MKTISVPLSEAQAHLDELVDQVKAGSKITITAQGKPAAILGPVPSPCAPWRMTQPDDPAQYGDLQSPVMDLWR